MDIKAQLKPLTQAGRLGFLLKARLNGTITPEKYDFYLHLDYGDTDTTAIEESREMGADVREHGNGVGVPDEQADGHDSEGGEGRGEVNQPAQCEPATAPVECNDKSVLPRCTNGSRLGEAGTHSDIIPGDSQNARVWRLLQDGAWHDANEIQQRVYGAQNGLCAIPSRVSNINAKLREKGKGKIESRAKEGSLWEWRYVETISPFYGG